MRDGEEADVDHRFAEGWLDDTVAHADDEEEEEGKGVTAGIEDGHDDKKHFCDDIGAVVVLVVVEAPGHEIFDNEEDNDGGDVVLNWEDIVAVLDIEEAPEDANDGVDDGNAGIEGEFGDLRGG